MSERTGKKNPSLYSLSLLLFTYMYIHNHICEPVCTVYVYTQLYVISILQDSFEPVGIAPLYRYGNGFSQAKSYVQSEVLHLTPNFRHTQETQMENFS